MPSVNRIRRGAIAIAAIACAVILLGLPRLAEAACHEFTVSVTPASVSEGGSVTVTVTRDGAVAPSNVDVSTINETAKSGQDYTALNQTVEFSNETQRTFTIPTTEDAVHEPTETFRVHLSNPGGCIVNPNFVLGPDARVTIQDDDPAPTSSPSPSTSPSSSPGPTSSPTALPTASPTTSESPAPTPSATGTPEPTPSDSPGPVTSPGIAEPPSSDGDFSGTLTAIAGGLAALTAAGLGLFALHRTRARL